MMPTKEQVETWKETIQKRHGEFVVKCFSCPELDWNLYGVADRPCVFSGRFVSRNVCRVHPELEFVKVASVHQSTNGENK